MTLKQYKAIKMFAVMFLAFVTARAVVTGNFTIPLLGMAGVIFGLWYLRRRVKEVLVDERDLQVGGKAAIIAIQIFSWIVVVLMFALYAYRGVNPDFVRAASLLAYAVCLLLSTYSGAYWYLNRHEK